MGNARTMTPAIVAKLATTFPPKISLILDLEAKVKEFTKCDGDHVSISNSCHCHDCPPIKEKTRTS